MEYTRVKAQGLFLRALETGLKMNELEQKFSLFKTKICLQMEF